MMASTNVIAAKCLGFLLICSFNSNTYAQNLQRFFMLEEERVMLDQASVGPLEKTTSEAVGSALNTIGEFEPLVVTLTGLVVRNNHQHTIWLNGYALSVKELPPSLFLNSATATLVQVKPNHGGYSSIAIGQNLLIIDSDYIKAFRQRLMTEPNAVEVSNDVDNDFSEAADNELILDESFES